MKNVTGQGQAFQRSWGSGGDGVLEQRPGCEGGIRARLPEEYLAEAGAQQRSGAEWRAFGQGANWATEVMQMCFYSEMGAAGGFKQKKKSGLRLSNPCSGSCVANSSQGVRRSQKHHLEAVGPN